MIRLAETEGCAETNAPADSGDRRVDARFHLAKSNGALAHGVSSPVALLTNHSALGERVTQHVTAKHREENERARKHAEPRFRAHRRLRLVEHVAPARGGWLDAHAEEAEC